MSFVNAPLSLLQKPPQNVLGAALGGAVGGYRAIQKLRAQNLLNQLQKAQAQSAQAQAGIAPQLAAAQVAKIPLAQQLLQAQIAKAKRIPVQGAFSQGLEGVFNIAKERGLNPQQTAQLLDQFAASQQKKGISLGFGAGGGLSSLNIGGSGGAAGSLGGGIGIPGGTGQLAPGAQVPGTGQSRRSLAGGLKVTDDKGEVKSIPTKKVSGTMQLGVVGNQKFQTTLNDYENGVSPYVGPTGKAKHAHDLYLSQKDNIAGAIGLPGIFGTPDAEIKAAKKRLEDYNGAMSSRIGLATDAARMASGGVPASVDIQKWYDSLTPKSISTSEIFREGIANRLRNMGNKWADITKKGLGGISVGQISPAELQKMKQLNQAAQQTGSLSQIFFPHEQIVANAHAAGVANRTPPKINIPKAAAPAAKATGTIKIRLPDGRIGSIPATALDQAIKMGAKRI